MRVSGKNRIYIDALEGKETPAASRLGHARVARPHELADSRAETMVVAGADARVIGALELLKLV